MELKTTKEQVLKAASLCSQASNVLQTLFPEAFVPEWKPVRGELILVSNKKDGKNEGGTEEGNYWESRIFIRMDESNSIYQVIGINDEHLFVRSDPFDIRQYKYAKRDAGVVVTMSSNDAPKVGDAGYFYDVVTDDYISFLYGTLSSINLQANLPYVCKKHNSSWKYFSKTAPMPTLI